MDNTVYKYHQWINQLLEEGKTVQVPVYGMSMFPMLLPRDVVQIKKQSVDALRPGQVLVYESGGRWVAHRLIKVDASVGLVYTRGDGLPREDEPLPVEKIKGVVTRVVRSRSPLARLINTPADKFLVKCGPVTGFFFFWLGRVTLKVRGLFK